MITNLQAIFLGIVQGITEWLPVSSSGHLVIFQQLFAVRVPVFFDLILHVGTLSVILIFFWKDILKIFKSLINLDFKSEDGRLLYLIILGNIPTTLIGFIFHDIFVSFFSSLLSVGIALLINGFILYFSEIRREDKQLATIDSLLIGISQGISLIPGISRSGITITTGLLRGVKRNDVFKYSFLLSIPAVLGATLLELRNIIWTDVDILPVILGTLTATFVGYFSLKFLKNIVLNKKFHNFSYYCWILGIFVILISVIL